MAAREYAYRQPWSISPTLEPTMTELGLLGSAEQLREEGYTIVHDAYDQAFCAEIRADILEAARKEKGHYFDIKPGEGLTAYHLLGKSDSFAQALLNPKLLVLAEYLCGGDFLLSQLAASVRFEGSTAMGLHIDSQWIPPTPYNPMFTACLALDDLSEEAGTTLVVPETHKLMRNPEQNEDFARKDGVPMTCKTGGFAIWTGFAWHANYPRKIPGERVMLHMTFCRLAYRPVEDYSNLGDDFLSQWPPIMGTMLGRDAWMGLAGRNEGACDMNHYTRMWNAARR
jgi:ectoine hydroxylase-related dioxygenase (phytanoyl-CoA dioxygenase family)